MKSIKTKLLAKYIHTVHIVESSTLNNNKSSKNIFSHVHTYRDEREWANKRYILLVLSMENDDKNIMLYIN